MELDIRLLTASYVRKIPATLKLFGRTREGQSVVVLDNNFSPYYHIVDPAPDHIEMAEKHGSYMGMKSVDLKVGQDTFPSKMVYVKAPWMVPQIRDKLIKEGARVYAADILYPLRYIYDKDVGGCATVKGDEDEEAAVKYGVDIALSGLIRWKHCDPFTPPLICLAFDMENSIKTDNILCISLAYSVLGDTDNIETMCITGTTRQILNRFEDIIEDIGPDVIMGHNINNYDLVELQERSKKARKTKKIKLGVGKDTIGQKSNTWRTDGRVVVDSIIAARKMMKPKRETLNFIANELLGEAKDDVDTSKIDEEWENRQSEVIKYCINDSVLSLKIIYKLRAIERGLDLAAVSNQPLAEAVIGGNTTWLVDAKLIPAAAKAGYAVPMNRFTGKKGQHDKFEGAFVKDAAVGLHDYVCVLDYKSMYPSVIINYNICFSTKVDEGGKASPCGAHFLQADEKKGILPMVMENMLLDRIATKKKMAEAEDEADRAYYDGLQEAIKILMNSFFGGMGADFYRFTDKSIGESITTWAKENIRKLIVQLEKEGLSILISDTDSVFVPTPEYVFDGYDSDENKAIAFGKELEAKYSGGVIELEFEKLLHPLFTHGAKKRYVGQIVWPKQKLLVRGYEVRRTDSIDVITDTMTEMFELLMNWEEDGMVELAKERTIQLIKKEFDVNKLVLSKSCKAEKEYVNPSVMAQVNAVRKLKAMGYQFTYGMKVSFIVTDGSVTPMGVEPVINGQPLPEPDWDYYARRLTKAIGRLTEPFGLDGKRLLVQCKKDVTTGTKQKNLFSF